MMIDPPLKAPARKDIERRAGTQAALFAKSLNRTNHIFFQLHGSSHELHISTLIQRICISVLPVFFAIFQMPLKIFGFVPIDIGDRYNTPLAEGILEFEDDLNSARNAAIRGESWGWTALYRNLAPTVIGYLRAQGAAEPEDLAAEVFVQAVRNIKRFQGNSGAFRSWIFCIAHNKLIDDARYRSRRPVQPVPDAGLDRVSPTAVEDQVLNNLSSEGVHQTLAGLTPDQRSVLFLRILGELTIEEVARTLNKNATAIKALQRRGLACLKKEMSDQTVSI